MISHYRGHGRIAAVLLMLLVTTSAYSVTVNTQISNPVIGVGQSTVMTIEISGSGDIEPVSIPRVNGLNIAYSGMGRNIVINNWKRVETISLSFQVTGKRKGSYTIPPCVFSANGKQFKSQPVQVKVIRGAEQQQGGQYSLEPEIAISKQRVFVGEPVVLSYYSLSSNINIDFIHLQNIPETRGFIIHELQLEPESEVVTENGIDYLKTKVASFVLVPAQAGKFNVGGSVGEFRAEVPSGDSFFGHSVTRGVRLPYDILPLEVVKLPAGSAPKDFKGDVGDFKLKVEFSNDPVEIFQEKEVTVTVSGSGNFFTMTNPVFEKEAKGAKVISQESNDNIQFIDNKLTGEKKFTLTIIPKKAGMIDLGTISFSFFNPETRSYQTVKSDPVLFEATGEGSEGRMNFDSDEEEGPDFNPAIIAGIVVSLGLIIFFFVMWERRRYKIVADEDTSEKKKNDLKTEVKNDKDYLSELEEAVRNYNSSSFLTAADKLLAMKIKGGDSDKDKMEKIDAVKEKIYFYRFGGGTISDNDMNSIVEDIKAILKK